MIGAGVGRERVERRIGWTLGPGLTLTDGGTWFLPAVDSSIVPCLPDLLPPAEAIRVIGAFHGTAGLLDPELPDLIRSYLLSALAWQYRTPRAELEELARSAATPAEFADPTQGLVVVRHLIAVGRLARRWGLVGIGLPARGSGVN